MDRTNAKRQARHRNKMVAAGEYRRINYWLPKQIFELLALHATRYGKSKWETLSGIVINHQPARVWSHITKKSRRHKLRDKSEA